MDHDIRTVRKVLRGEIDCFEELILKYESKVYRTCWRFVKNNSDAEDITQEVFIKIYNNLSSYKKDSSFSTWVYRITVNSCLDFLRKNNRLILEYKDELETGSAICPDEMVEAMELREIMKSGLHSLDRKNAEIFLNRVKHNMPFKEIAKKAGMTPVAARMRFSRTQKMLKEAAQKYREGE